MNEWVALRAVLDVCPDAMLIVDRSGTIRAVNRLAAGLFGYREHELEGAPLSRLLPDGIRERHARHLQAYFAAPTVRRMGAQDFPAIRSDGTVVYLDVGLSPIPDPPGLVVASFREVTERRRIEHELRDAKQAAERDRARLTALLEDIPDLVIAIDLGGTILFINRTVERAIEEVVGTSWLSYVGPDQQRVMQESLDRVLATGQPDRFEVEYASSGNKPLRFASHIAPIRERGAITGAVILSRDITEQRQLEAQLRESDRMASMGMLAAGVAHEINNPLAAVICNVEIALEDLEQARRVEVDGVADIEVMLRDSREAAERIREIVRDLRLFSRGEDERPGPVDVRDVLESTLRLAWNEIRHRARVVKQYALVPRVLARQSQLGQVFLNLVINAAQAIPAGRAASNEIRAITKVGEDGSALIEIADTGHGIPREHLPRLFTPFFTTKPRATGTGLGLAICARIVKQLGGRIEVESEVGRGTVFRVWLPATTEPPAVPTQLRHVESARRGRILVIDDDPAIGAVIQRICGVEHDVTVVDSAAAALSRLGADALYDLLLCDVMMPEMTGIELLEQLRRDRPAEAERVVFLTGGVFTPESGVFFDALEPHRRLAKPFEPTELRRVVNDCIHRFG